MDTWNSDFWQKNAAFCIGEVSKDTVWEQIPLINLMQSHTLKEGQLVRFRGMVQDMYNPVYYLDSYEVEDTITNNKTVRSGKYKDSLNCGENERILFESDQSINQERIPVYCITVPALNHWAKSKKNEISPASQGSVSKEQSIGASMKRSIGDDEELTELDRVTNTNDSKRTRTDCAAMDTDTNSQVVDLNLPIPNSDAEACLINFYDFKEGQLKINDVIEVAGFLSYDSASVLSSLDDLEEELPPPSLLPRLHAVSYRPVNTCNPLLTHTSLDDVMMNAQRLRDDLKLVFTQLLLGDVLAAEYLICHLMAHIYLRQDVLVLGKFSLNLSNVPSSVPDYATRLYDFLQGLLVKSHFLPMTIRNMNSITMIPKKNYKTNRLESGMLQLSSKTHLIIDETQMEPGQLNDKGVRNCRALGSVIVNQRLEYDFEFYPIEFLTDIPVLILSEGKSLLPSDCHLPLDIDPSCLSTIDEVFTAASHFLREPLISQLRAYLSLAPSADYNLTPEMEKLVQEDFVKMRQEQPKFSPQDLHSLLVLSKFLSLSQGSKVLTRECWEATQQMERQRKSRLLV